MLVDKKVLHNSKNLKAKTDQCGEKFNVEYFPSEFSNVHLTSRDDPNLPKLLKEIDDGGVLALDLEWKPDFNGKFNHIALFQIGSSKGAF